ncbi:unnamed protein product [Auanema sp. JU1783]|nr:unnamed protein product [Auanema sp. JU1783]
MLCIPYSDIMSLVQVQRSPTPSIGDESESLELDDSRCSSRNRTLSECYFAVKSAAVILPHRFLDENSTSHSHSSAEATEIEMHLQLMLRLLRPQDTMNMAVRLQTQIVDHIRYLAVVSAFDAERRVLLLGMDYHKGQMSIGVVLPLLWCSRVELSMDGGVAVHGSSETCSKADNAILFRPISVQAMCYFGFVFQSLHKELEITRENSPKRLKEPATGTQHYMDRISSLDFLCAQWQQSPLDVDEDYGLKADTVRSHTVDETVQAKETVLRKELRQIMQSVDLDSVTSKDIRESLSKRFGNVDNHKDFIDQEMLVILGQLDKPSIIFPYLLLGTEWNASNWEELKANNVGYILNMTREVDNFFPQHFEYRKIWVTDEANTQLLNHWNMTWAFIKKAKESGKVCLVHCKKGISRSSSTVIAFAMKEYGWSLEKALDHVKKCRNCITPNKGFIDQLRMFHGALEASRYRHSPQFNGRMPRAHSASCRATQPRPATVAVRGIVSSFERRRDSTEPSSHFPLDVINKRNSIQQIS